MEEINKENRKSEPILSQKDKDFKGEELEEDMDLKIKPPRIRIRDLPNLKVPKKIKLQIKQDIIDLRKIQARNKKKGLGNKWQPPLL